MFEGIERQFADLQRSLQALHTLLPHHFQHVWQQNNNTDIHDIGQQLLDIYYQDNSDGRLTRSYIGVVAADEKIVEQIILCNQHKLQFKSAVIALKKQDEQHWLQAYQQLNKRPRIIQNQLVQNDLTRLHLKQCYRQIPLLKQSVKKISFNWYNSGRSIKRLSKEQALNQLLKLNTASEHIQIQIQQLNNCQEPFFAQVQKQAPLVRANICYKNGHREAFNCSLPIFYGGQPGETIIDIQPLIAKEQIKQRALRSDAKIDHTLFLPSLRLFRYK